MRQSKLIDVFYDPQYTLSSHHFETTRKAKWIAESLREDPIRGIRLATPAPVSVSDLLLLHSAEYISALQSGLPVDLAESQGFAWDQYLLPMTLSTTGGMVAAMIAAIEVGVAGTLSTGLHHARKDSGCGFCTINGLALAAKKALTKGVQSVLMLDLDAHCGGGPQDCISGDSRIYQLDISVHGFDQYKPSNNSRLVMVDDGYDYLTSVEYELENLLDEGRSFDLCIYNAGMDPFDFCTNGGKEGISMRTLARREELVFSWCRSHRIPVAFTIAGGYLGGRLDQCDLIRLHRMTVQAAAHAFLDTGTYQA